LQGSDDGKPAPGGTGVGAIALIHRTGVVPIGEAAVVVAVSRAAP